MGNTQYSSWWSRGKGQCFPWDLLELKNSFQIVRIKVVTFDAFDTFDRDIDILKKWEIQSTDESLNKNIREILPSKQRWVMSDNNCQADEMQTKLNNVGWWLLSGHEQIKMNDERWWMLSRQEANEDKQCQVMFTEQLRKRTKMLSFLDGLFTLDS